MTHFLKHISLRLWASIALGVPVSLALLPTIQARFGMGGAPLAAAGILLVLAFFLTGWLFHRLGLALAEGRIREAGVCERAGAQEEARRAYAAAAAVFDSFLISPRIRRLRSHRLTARLARFYLSRGEGNGHGRKMVTDYVRANPGDIEVADAWLRRTAGTASLDPGEQEAALAIAEAHEDNPQIQKNLASLYLAARRTDFAALATYQRALDPQGGGDEQMVTDLANLFVQEGRVDDWAMSLYLGAFAATKDKIYLRGVAACTHWLKETSRNARELDAGRRLVAGFDERQMTGMRTGFVPPETEPAIPDRRMVGALRLGIDGTKGAVRMLASLSGRLGAVSAAAVRGAAHQVERLQRSARMRRRLIWAAALLAGAGALVFLVNTAGHLLQPRTRPVHSPIPAAVPVTDKFTIQVAAYLKKVHAEKFVEELKKKDIDAYWAEASGKNKRWFQVRVHHFPDKASARAYGEALKAKGIIDDFYVANYIRP